MQRKGALPGKISARCIPKRLFAGHFGCMARISCQSQPVFGCMACESCRELAIFPSEAAFGMHGAQNLPRTAARERTAAESCHGKTPENASRENIAAASRPSRSALHVGEWVQSLGCAVGFGAQHFLCEGVGIPPSRGLTAGNDFESALFRWATMSPLRVLQSCAVLCAEAKSALTFI